MSAPLRLTSVELADLAKFLDEISKATRATGCNLTPYSDITVSIGTNHGVQVTWEPDTGYGEYVVRDQVGS